LAPLEELPRGLREGRPDSNVAVERLASPIPETQIEVLLGKRRAIAAPIFPVPRIATVVAIALTSACASR